MSDDGSTKNTAQKTPSANDGGHSLVERIFGALASKRRRYVLYCLQDQEHMEVEALATQITAWEQGVRRNDVPPDTRQDVQVNLVHSHLPKLADYELIEYDERSGAIRYTDAPAAFEEVLGLAARLEKPA